jgi:biopolymer transport protein ExbD
MDFSSRNKIKLEGGMASMTDLVFLLLIFFVIMSLMANNQKPVDLPKASEEVKSSKDPVQPTVIITENNSYIFMNGKQSINSANLSELKPSIEAAVEKTKKNKLRIAGHKKAKFSYIHDVLRWSRDEKKWITVLSYSK